MALPRCDKILEGPLKLGSVHVKVGDGWAISHINGQEILEMPFVKESLDRAAEAHF